MLQMSPVLKLAVVALLLSPLLVDLCRGDTSSSIPGRTVRYPVSSSSFWYHPWPFHGSYPYNGYYYGAYHWGDSGSYYAGPYGGAGWPSADYYYHVYPYVDQGFHLQQIRLLQQQVTQLQQQVNQLQGLREKVESLEAKLDLNTTNTTAGSEDDTLEKVESNSRDIMILNTTQADLRDQLTDLEQLNISDLQRRVDELQGRVEEHTERLDEQAGQIFSLEMDVAHLKEIRRDAFTATLEDDDSMTLNQGDVLVFNNVIFSVHPNAYDNSNGYFTAPYSGSYAFFTTVRSRKYSEDIQLAFYKGETLLFNFTDPEARGKSEGTGLVTLDLETHEQVSIRHVGDTTQFTPSSSDTLSGWLLSVKDN